MSFIHRRTIRGEPIRVGQKDIVPEAQVTWWMRRSATMGARSAGGWGAGLVDIRPIAVIERSAGGERRIPIHDETGRLLIGLAAGAVFVLFLAEIAERLAITRGGKQR